MSSAEPTPEIVATPTELGPVIDYTAIDAQANPAGEALPDEPTDVSIDDVRHMTIDEGDELEPVEDIDLEDEE